MEHERDWSVMASSPSLSHEPMVRRIVRRAERLPESLWAFAADWYDREADWLESVGSAFGFDRTQSVYAFAALSPRMQYKANRSQLVKLMAGQDIGGLENSRKAATAALLHTKLPSGRKTGRFALNLAGDREPVTVDVWICRSVGLAKDAPSLSEYSRIERAFQAAAKRLGCSPRTLQAAIWFGIRGATPSDPIAYSPDEPTR